MNPNLNRQKAKLNLNKTAKFVAKCKIILSIHNYLKYLQMYYLVV